jgi:hypothetical protein
MKSTNIKLLAFATVIGLILSACGSNNKSSTTMIPECGTAADLGKSIARDVTGKTIKKVDIGAEVRIWHSPDTKKSACMIKGQAEII